MSEFMMLMHSGNNTSDAAAWTQYISVLSKTGMFNGGSALGNGICVSQNSSKLECSVSGYMRFEADTIDQVLALVPGNPVIESGGTVEVLELLKT